MEYHELRGEEKRFVDSKMSTLGVNPANLTSEQIDEFLQHYQPAETDLERWHRYNNLTVAQRRARQLQEEANRKPGDGLPTADEAPDIARKFRVNVNFIRTKEQEIAEAELEQRQKQVVEDEATLKDAIKNKDVVTLVEFGNTHSNEEYRVTARAAMAEILPSFDTWTD